MGCFEVGSKIPVYRQARDLPESGIAFLQPPATVPQKISKNIISLKQLKPYYLSKLYLDRK